MERKIDFTVKHREDVIDILQVRVKEKKVLLGLIIILVCTLGYENYDYLSKLLFNYEFSVPELGERKPPTIKPDMIKALSRKLVPVEELFPQFVLLFSRFHDELDQAAALAEKEENRAQATYNTYMIAREMYRFANNPVLPESKELKELRNALEQLQKKFKFDIRSENEIKIISFVGGERQEAQANIHRSLFDYENF